MDSLAHPLPNVVVVSFRRPPAARLQSKRNLKSRQVPDAELGQHQAGAPHVVLVPCRDTLRHLGRLVERYGHGIGALSLLVTVALEAGVPGMLHASRTEVANVCAAALEDDRLRANCSMHYAEALQLQQTTQNVDDRQERCADDVALLAPEEFRVRRAVRVWTHEECQVARVECRKQGGKRIELARHTDLAHHVNATLDQQLAHHTRVVAPLRLDLDLKCRIRAQWSAEARGELPVASDRDEQGGADEQLPEPRRRGQQRPRAPVVASAVLQGPPPERRGVAKRRQALKV
mmetsp:Transcript_117441/g.336913  ORF Transcript_117441/g.336913 Transcript_117441/m.336913 type:complete len:290 (-) Transcript_117441:339-1208(-)